ncbi:MAG: hypothetical protein GF308_21440 [Candidatus Heimdallarchaeota archaeon]|nr:hypothetical protein [Candidatus Heimdallarchaeota archaeon]
MMENCFLAEANIALDPYMGLMVNIGNDSEKIIVLSEESPIAVSEIVPGEVVLCEKEPLYKNTKGEVFKVLRRFTFHELLDFLEENPSVEFKCWDYETVAPYKIARAFFPTINRMKKGKKLSLEEIGLLIQSIMKALKIPENSYIFPQDKLKIYEMVLEALTPSFKVIFLETLYREKLVLSSYEILLALFPTLWSSVPEYICSANAHKEIIDVIHNKWPTEVKIERIKEIFLKDIELWLYLSGTDEINFELLSKSEFSAFSKRILEIRKAKVKNATVYYKGKSKKSYDISSLRETTLGKKLLQSLKVSENRKWIDQHLFDLIEITFRKFKIEINLEKTKS